MYKTSIQTMVFILAFILLLTGCAKNQQSPAAVPSADITQLPDERAASAPPAQTLPDEPSASPTMPEDNGGFPGDAAAAQQNGSGESAAEEDLPYEPDPISASGKWTIPDLPVEGLSSWEQPSAETLPSLEELGEEYPMEAAALDGYAVLCRRGDILAWHWYNRQWAEEFIEKVKNGESTFLRFAIYNETSQRIYDITYEEMADEGVFVSKWYEDGSVQWITRRIRRTEADYIDDPLYTRYGNDPDSAEADGCVLYDLTLLDITAGRDAWECFYQKTLEGVPAKVKIAVIRPDVSGDADNCEMELRELEYDGEYYTLRQYYSGIGCPGSVLDLDLQSVEVTGPGEALLYEENYSWLLKLGLYPQRAGIAASKPVSWNYVLVHDDAYTFLDLINSHASGIIGGQIPYSLVVSVPADTDAGEGAADEQLSTINK